MARRPSLPIAAIIVCTIGLLGSPSISGAKTKQAPPATPQVVDPAGDTMDVDGSKGDWGDITGVMFSSLKDRRGKLTGFKITLMTVGDTSKFTNGARFRVQWNLDSKTSSCSAFATMIFGGTSPGGLQPSDVTPGQWTGSINFECDPLTGQARDATTGQGPINVAHSGTWTWAQIPLSTFAHTTSLKEYRSGARFIYESAASWRQNYLGYGTLEALDQAPDVCSLQFGSCFSKGPPPKMEPAPADAKPFILGH